MLSSKQVLTTGDVAKICSVAPRTVSKWFDSGQLRGYRIPGSKDRRIPVDQLIRFMQSHGIPLDGLDVGLTRVLIVDADLTLAQTIRDALTVTKIYDVILADSAFEGGAMTMEHRPHVIVVDLTLPDVSPRAIARFIQSNATVSSTVIIGTGEHLTQARGQALLQDGFTHFLSKPFRTSDLRTMIESLVGPEETAVSH